MKTNILTNLMGKVVRFIEMPNKEMSGQYAEIVAVYIRDNQAWIAVRMEETDKIVEWPLATGSYTVKVR